MRVLSPADPGYVEWCRSGMPQRIRLLKLAAEKRRRIEQGVICPKCHRPGPCRRHVVRPVPSLGGSAPLPGMREADEPSRGRVVRPMPETGPGTGQADVPEMRQVPVPRGRGHVRQVPGAPCVAILFSLRRAAAEGLAGRVVRPMPAAPFGEGEDMNPMDVALEALYLLGVVLCCALLSREEGSREGLGSRRARLFMLALAVEAMQAGLGSLAFREPWGAPFAPWQAFDLTGAVLADLFLAWALLRGDGGAPGPDYR